MDPVDVVKGMGGVGFKLGVTHDDPPPPDALGSDVVAGLEELNAENRFRFANHLPPGRLRRRRPIAEAEYGGGRIG